MFRWLSITFRQMDRIILASGSPRRKQLLQQAEIEFDIQVADIDETPPSGMPVETVPEYLAIKKAKVVAGKNNDAVIIAADTVVILENEILGKPEDEDDAKAILKKLSGKVHLVVSGVCIRYGANEHSFSDKTEVHFNTLSDEQIAHYVQQYKPFDKAGAYAIQEWIGLTGIQKINGDYYNVMGLPVNRVISYLQGL